MKLYNWLTKIYIINMIIKYISFGLPLPFGVMLPAGACPVTDRC